MAPRTQDPEKERVRLINALHKSTAKRASLTARLEAETQDWKALIVSLYGLSGVTQFDIAEVAGTSRARIAELVREARAAEGEQQAS